MKQRGNNTQLTPGDAKKKKKKYKYTNQQLEKEKKTESSSAMQRNFSFCSTQFSITSADGKTKFSWRGEPASHVLGNEQHGAFSLGGLSGQLSCECPTDCYCKAVSRCLGSLTEGSQAVIPRQRERGRRKRERREASGEKKGISTHHFDQQTR